MAGTIRYRPPPVRADRSFRMSQFGSYGKTSQTKSLPSLLSRKVYLPVSATSAWPSFAFRRYVLAFRALSKLAFGA